MSNENNEVFSDPFAKRFPITQSNGDSGVIYTVFFFDEVTEIFEFAELISVLDNAVEGDTVIFHINSPGGYLHAMLTILDAIKNSKAQTIAQCSGTVASAATMIALACDGMYVAPYTKFMCHNFTGGTYGKGNEIAADIQHIIPNNKRMMHDVYHTFLSKKEINKMLQGKDYHFTHEESMERWKKVVEYRENLIMEEQKSLREEQLQSTISYLEEEGYVVSKTED